MLRSLVGSEMCIRDRTELSSAIDSLNDRCALLGRRIERERRDRQQDSYVLQQSILEQVKSLEGKIESEKTAQEEREAAAYHHFSQQQSLVEDKMTEQKKYLEAAIAYVRTSVEQEKMARSTSENKLLTALQQVSVKVQISMTETPLAPQVKAFKDLEARVTAIDIKQSQKVGSQQVDMRLLMAGLNTPLLPGPGTCFTDPTPNWKPNHR
eukprot:TRINITY_DN25545_c0_g1_i3.p1 TRINITY_DN25545_c0_g1~~TRINITY_DN25545_c0_g1_i3.p1  ORF type:complete len:225 (+),score=81.49 TRINITY_DN25545_c0_g1_i3:46-675(+)